MTAYWTPTVASYLGRVTKGRIAQAVGEAVSEDAAARIGGLKKPEMASEAEALLAGTGWLPSLLRRPEPRTVVRVSVGLGIACLLAGVALAMANLAYLIASYVQGTWLVAPNGAIVTVVSPSASAACRGTIASWILSAPSMTPLVEPRSRTRAPSAVISISQ